MAWKADPATRTFQVRVVVDNEGGHIRPGMIARGAFLRRLIEDAVTAPLFTVQDKGGERVVFVEQDGVARARTVQLGIIEGAVCRCFMAWPPVTGSSSPVTSRSRTGQR